MFDLGASVADVTGLLGSKSAHRLAETTIDPRELLWGILHTLSQIRGSPSYLFPILLERSKNVLGLDCTITMGNFLPALGATMPDNLGAWPHERGWEMPEQGHEVHDVQSERANSVSNISPMSHAAPPDLGFQEDCLLA